MTPLVIEVYPSVGGVLEKPSRNKTKAILKGSKAISQLISAGYKIFHSFAAITPNEFS